MQSSREGLVVVVLGDDDPLREKFPVGDGNRDDDWRDADGALAKKFYDSLPVGTKFVFGCGSFEVSWLRCGGEVFAVNGSVDPLMFLAQVEAPVRVEVAAGDDGAELQDGLGAFESPSRARDIHSVLDDVPAGALDDPGGDGPAFVQRGGVVQVAVFVVQVAGGFAAPARSAGE